MTVALALAPRSDGERRRPLQAGLAAGAGIRATNETGRGYPQGETVRGVDVDGLAELFTANRFGLPAALRRRLPITNSIDSSPAGVRSTPGASAASATVRWPSGGRRRRFVRRAKDFRRTSPATMLEGSLSMTGYGALAKNRGCFRISCGRRTLRGPSRDGQKQAGNLPRAPIPNVTSYRVDSVIRPVFSVAGRSRPAITSSEPARASSHPTDGSDSGGSAKRLDSAGAEATPTPHLPTRFPEEPNRESEAT